MAKWQQYYDKVGEKPNSLVLQAVEKTKSRQAALDLGAGNLRDSKYLLSKGFARVIAVDHLPDSREFLVDGIELHISAIECGEIAPEFYDLVICCNTFFFIDSCFVKRLFGDVLEGLRPGGIFACNVLGKEDDWVLAGNPVSSFIEEELLSLCNGFKVIDGLSEVRYNDGQKNWHLWSLLLQKP